MAHKIGSSKEWLVGLAIYSTFYETENRHGWSRGGAIAQLVKQWSRNPATRVRNQGNALVPFGKALILITRSLGDDVKPSVLWLLTNKHACFLSS